MNEAMDFLTKERVAEYASYALQVRNRQDVYDACVALLRHWHIYSGDDERRQIFFNIGRESVGNPRLAVNSPQQLNHAYQGWKMESAIGVSDPVVEAYEKEMKRK